MRIALPRNQGGWERLASGVLRSNLGMALTSTNELARALARIGVTQSVAAISHKLASGRFSAAFLLQCLVAIGTEELDLRVRSAPGQAPPVSAPAARHPSFGEHGAGERASVGAGEDWARLTAGIVAEQMAIADIGHAELSKLLSGVGVDEDAWSLAAKLRRGKFLRPCSCRS